jgi:predicted deacetylase
MKVIVAIHDVTPAFAHQVETLWDICKTRGITPALFVVPSWHGQWPVEEDPRFCGWVRRLAAEGAEVFLHGERHDEVGAERTLWDTMRAFGRTDREAEFLTLPRAAARNRIARGLLRLRSAGLKPIGFVAPAWLSSRGAVEAVGDVGLRYSEDGTCIHVIGRGRLKAPAIRWSARTLFRAHASVAVAAAARATLREPLIRIALHPRDVRSAPVRRSLVRTLDSYSERGWPAQYSQI